MAKRYTLEEFKEKANKLHNNFYSYDKTIYKNKRTKVVITCPIHGDFEQTPDSHCNGKNGCLICNQSHGESTIENYLLSRNILFIKQHKFNGCKNISYLKFDFYMPELNMCIEYDGIQHFEPVEHFGGEEQFQKQKINDKIKDEYCKNNNIHLLRIPYYESIEDKLNTIKVK